MGRSYSFGYDAAGNLTSVTDPLLQVTSYTYDESNSNTSLQSDLLTVTRPNGQSGGPDAGAHTTNTYNTAGLVTSQTDPMGRTTSFNLTNMNTLTGNGVVVVTDPNGNKTRRSITKASSSRRPPATGPLRPRAGSIATIRQP